MKLTKELEERIQKEIEDIEAMKLMFGERNIGEKI